jgi:hypothetical protein
MDCSSSGCQSWTQGSVPTSLGLREFKRYGARGPANGALPADVFNRKLDLGNGDLLDADLRETDVRLCRLDAY